MPPMASERANLERQKQYIHSPLRLELSLRSLAVLNVIRAARYLACEA